MKKIVYLLVGLLIFTTSCEDFLDSQSYTEKTTGNFPLTLEDAQQMLAGIYVTQNLISESCLHTYYFAGDIASDDRFGSGGDNDKESQAYDKLMANKEDMLKPFWSGRYQGIFRTNMALETIDNCEGITEEQKNQIVGEVHFLRGFFYHEMAECFGNFPLVVSTATENLPKAETDDIYAQIAYDLKTAIELMPSKPYTAVESGHATKWDAEAVMARTFMFYTGFFGKESLPLGSADGTIVGSITKDQVIAWLEDCINNSGHRLVNDFRALWPYANTVTKKDYNYVSDITWAGDGNANTEKMFSIKFSTMGSWDDLGYSNQFALYQSLRNGGGANGYEGTFPFGRGWGIGTVNPEIWNEWDKNDMRRKASILDVTDPTEVAEYSWGEDSHVEETGYWNKKCMNYQGYGADGTLYEQFGFVLWGSQNDIALGNPTDLPLIRFADVLLMHSELKQDVSGINQVRARAGLAPLAAYSLEALKKERRFELCFEGRRWADIRRWGDAANVLESNQIGQSVYNSGKELAMKNFGPGIKARYQQTNGFFPIPESEIRLSSGVLTQNAGWGTADALYQSW